MNIYQLEVRAICPIHANLIDVYKVRIECHETIEVEKILEFFKPYKTRQVFQEDLTKQAAVSLGARVETEGIHSGVKVVSIAP